MRDLGIIVPLSSSDFLPIDRHSCSQWSNEKRLSIHTSQVLFATNGSDGTRIMQPNMQP